MLYLNFVSDDCVNVRINGDCSSYIRFFIGIFWLENVFEKLQ